MRPERLRTIGRFVLVAGIAGAVLFYWIASRSAQPTLEDLMPGSSASEARQVGILMGNFGVMMLGWAEALKQPGTQAIIIAGLSAFAAFCCFRVARLWDDEELER